MLNRKSKVVYLNNRAAGLGTHELGDLSLDL